MLHNLTNTSCTTLLTVSYSVQLTLVYIVYNSCTITKFYNVLMLHFSMNPNVIVTAVGHVFFNKPVDNEQ